MTNWARDKMLFVKIQMKDFPDIYSSTMEIFASINNCVSPDRKGSYELWK